MNKVSICLLNRNHAAFLEVCINSLLKQAYRWLEIIIIDNNSNDNSLDIIKNKYPNIKLIQNRFNKGYSKAHNDFIRTSNGEFLLFLNADIILDANFVNEVLKAIDEDEKIGMTQGKLYRMDTKMKKKDTLDSTGVILYKNRRNLDRGFGKKGIGQYNNKDYIFGTSGAALFCRREMLEDIKIGDEYFDEDFFAYREETDLAWRAQLAGWKCVYVPSAVAYHYRAYSPDRRKKMPEELRQLQYRNRYLMLMKNELPLTFILHLPFILFFEMFSFFYVLFWKQFLVKAWLEVVKLMPKMLKKRQQIMRKKRVTAKYILSIIK
ncbi:MAG: glycosyltransferase family 2 protein [Candidatus Omnitrophota bacterium]|nr:MAG: glycosyltransferase family 2 protein [Candidatus Omnitrophota bacterium]